MASRLWNRPWTWTATARATCSWSGTAAIELVALSGKDGSMIWNHVGERPTRRPATGSAGACRTGPPRHPRGSVIGQTWIDDVDGDGTPEVAATIVFQESPAEVAGGRANQSRPSFRCTTSASSRRSPGGRGGGCGASPSIPP